MPEPIEYHPHNPDNCECEHISHEDTHNHTEVAVKMVITDYGPFNLCKACLDANHMQRPYV